MSQLYFEDGSSQMGPGLGIPQDRIDYIHSHFDRYLKNHCPIQQIKEGIKIEVCSGELLVAFCKPANTKQEFAYCAWHAGQKTAEMRGISERIKMEIIKKVIESTDGHADFDIDTFLKNNL